MKRQFALSILILIASTHVYGADKFSFSATPSVGVTSGVVREYVIHRGYKPQTSRLDWITFANPNFQLDATASFFGVFINANTSINIPIPCGMMEDRDWENPNKGVYYPLPYHIIYSKHTMEYISRYNIGGQIGYKFNIKKFSLAPFIGVKYLFQSYNGRDGYQQTAEKPLEEGLNGDEPHNADYNRKVISYEQSLLLPSVGANFSFAFTEKLIAYLGCTFYPYMMINAMDKHFTNASGDGYVFYDTMRGGFGFIIDAAVEYKKFVFKFEYESVFHYTGETRSGSIGTSYQDAKFNDEYGSGTDSFMFKLSVGYKIN